jgi:hypothetical protein
VVTFFVMLVFLSGSFHALWHGGNMLRALEALMDCGIDVPCFLHSKLLFSVFSVYYFHLTGYPFLLSLAFHLLNRRSSTFHVGLSQGFENFESLIFSVL